MKTDEEIAREIVSGALNNSDYSGKAVTVVARELIMKAFKVRDKHAESGLRHERFMCAALTGALSQVRWTPDAKFGAQIAKDYADACMALLEGKDND